MDNNEYSAHLSAKLIKEFQEKFYDKIGTVPQVYFSTRSVASLSLFELNTELNKFIPVGLKSKGLMDIRDKTRIRAITSLRAIFCSLARSMDYTYEVIANYLKQDHTTIIYSVATFNKLMTTDYKFRELYNDCLISLNLEPITNDPTLLRAAA